MNESVFTAIDIGSEFIKIISVAYDWWYLFVHKYLMWNIQLKKSQFKLSSGMKSNISWNVHVILQTEIL